MYRFPSAYCCCRPSTTCKTRGAPRFSKRSLLLLLHISSSSSHRSCRMPGACWVCGNSAETQFPRLGENEPPAIRMCCTSCVCVCVCIAVIRYSEVCLIWCMSVRREGRGSFTIKSWRRMRNVCKARFYWEKN